jgi:hypothetical protein
MEYQDSADQADVDNTAGWTMVVRRALVLTDTVPAGLTARDWLVHRVLHGLAAEEGSRALVVNTVSLSNTLDLNTSRIKQSIDALCAVSARWAQVEVEYDRSPEEDFFHKVMRTRKTVRYLEAPLLTAAIKGRSIFVEFPEAAVSSLEDEMYVSVPGQRMREARTWAACRLYELARLHARRRRAPIGIVRNDSDHWQAKKYGASTRPSLWSQKRESLAARLGLDPSGKNYLRDLRLTIKRAMRLPGMPDLKPWHPKKNDAVFRYDPQSEAQAAMRVELREEFPYRSGLKRVRPDLYRIAYGRAPRRPPKVSEGEFLTIDGGIHADVGTYRKLTSGEE